MNILISSIFFHSSAFQISHLCHVWTTIALSFVTPLTVNGKSVCVVDAIKVGKAGHKMPGVKLLHQESEDNTKPEFVMGHFWGALSLLVCASSHLFALPLRFQIQDGIKSSPSENKTLIDKMASLVVDTFPQMGYLVADAYYATKNMILKLTEKSIHLITKVKSNTVAYLPLPPPPDDKKTRGRPRKYGDKVKLNTLFAWRPLFTPITLHVYGDLKSFLYYSVDLLWQSIPVRFVLTIASNGDKAILLSTDTSLPPETIMTLYGSRFKIEVAFKALIYVLAAFAYHFWMMAFPKRKHGSGDAFLHRSSNAFRQQVSRKIEAYERFVNFSAIALGILQILAVTYTSLIWDRFPLWLRTLPKHNIPTELVVRLTLQHECHHDFLENNDSTLLQKILATKKKRNNHGHPIVFSNG